LALAHLFDDYWRAAVAFTGFAVLHSVCAHEPFKKALAQITGQFFVDYFWRLIYCGLSYWALYYGIASLHWVRNPQSDIWLIAYPDWLWNTIIFAHLGSIALLYTAFIQSNYLEFLGFKQATEGVKILINGKQSQSDSMELFGTHRLVINGVYRWVRHPMLVGGLLFLLTSGPSLNNIVYTVMYSVYMVIGGYYEEKRMIKVFGQEYRTYQQNVGAYIPRLPRLKTT